MNKKKLVVFSGAGMSAESGIQTFRDTGGLWEQYNVEDVATYNAWIKNEALVLDFYNQRRKQIMQAQPNEAHKMVAALAKDFDVQVITQNIDDLHERAGSKKVLHLHGEIMKGRSTANADLIYDLKSWEIKQGDTCALGSQIRPHIVWFGEPVPEMENAILLAQEAAIFIIIGTSLNVYPAANLIHEVPYHVPKFLIDPGEFSLSSVPHLTIIKTTAVEGMKKLQQQLKKYL